MATSQGKKYGQNGPVLFYFPTKFFLCLIPFFFINTVAVSSHFSIIAASSKSFLSQHAILTFLWLQFSTPFPEWEGDSSCYHLLKSKIVPLLFCLPIYIILSFLLLWICTTGPAVGCAGTLHSMPGDSREVALWHCPALPAVVPAPCTALCFPRHWNPQPVSWSLINPELHLQCCPCNFGGQLQQTTHSLSWSF